MPPCIKPFAYLFLLSACLLLFTCADPTPEGDHAMEGLHVPDGYTLELAAGPDLVDYPMFATLDEQGRLFVFESTGNVYEKSQEAIDDPQFRIKLLQDEDGDGKYDKATIFADKLSFPQGGVFHQGSLIASSAPDLLKLTDTDGDGVADEREVLLSGWILNVNANSLIGPFKAPDGWLYMTNAVEGFDVTSKEGQRLKGGTSRIWRVRPDGTDLEWIAAGGMANPVELTFTDASEVIGTQTFFVTPERGLRDAITYWMKGGIYGRQNSNIARDSLTLTGGLIPVIAQYSRVAPSGIGAYRSEIFGPEFRDNLFTAQFNTHAVLRHQLLRDGASFRTEDEVFFHSDSEDFHPTDVLEDADGSLLVVETGGWFILGCPLSQVSKPQLKGSIYRIRRKDASEVEDAYGNGIKWASMTPADLKEYVGDLRPFVSDRAVEALVGKGEAAVEVLTELLSSEEEDIRTKAVFALYRIGSADAIGQVRQALSDESVQVKVAAARSVGLAKDTRALDRLQEMVVQEKAAVQRQAATALGQIGDAGSVAALLKAAESAQDRFIRHAVIYSLITINRPDLVRPALDHASVGVREAALIALDQMPDKPLKATQLTPFLTSPDSALQQTALWVAAHHPEWAGAMTGFLGSKLQARALTDRDRSLLSNILTSYCGNPEMQAFMAAGLKNGNSAIKEFILENMANCEVKDFPAVWTNELERQLQSHTDPLVKGRVVKLLRLRGIDALEAALTQLADQEANPPGLRIEAIGGLLEGDTVMADRHFHYLTRLINDKPEAPLMQQAAAVLAQAALTEDQQLEIAREVLPDADHFMLPRLLPVLQGAKDLEVGKAVAAQLMITPSLDNYSEENLLALFADYPPEIKPELDALLGKLRQVRSERLQRLTAWEGKIGNGNIERGKELYFGKAICWTCHAMGGKGGNLGPDLTSIQHDRSQHDILEAVIYPSATFVREYETYQIKAGGTAHLGIIQDETADFVLLATGPQTSVRIPRPDIQEILPMDVSLMPQGLDQLLTEDEFVDLIAFLMGADLVY